MASKIWAVRPAEVGIPVVKIRPGIMKTDITRESPTSTTKRSLTAWYRWDYEPDNAGVPRRFLRFGELLSLRGEFSYWVLDGFRQPAQRRSWNYRCTADAAAYNRSGIPIVTDEIYDRMT